LKWFERIRYQASVSTENHARALLIPAFEQLNRCLRRTSWFLPTLQIEETTVSTILMDLTSEFEQACYLLASGVENDMDIGPAKAICLKITTAA
jgi:hypothetical protein